MEQTIPTSPATDSVVVSDEAPKKEARKPNRRERRASLAISARQERAANKANERRMKCFQTLSDWKADAAASNKVSQEQIDSIFRVGLNKLFRKDFKERGSFERQLSAIINNVRKGFKYKADVAPQPAQEEVAIESKN
jgi:hypothetical protein